MLPSEIQNILTRKEGIEIEYKSAKGGFPLSFWETFSAFANTDGGIIILGIKEKNGQFFPDGLSENQVTELKKKFWDNIHNPNKISQVTLDDKNVYEQKISDNDWVLIVEVQRAKYNQKPVFLNGTPLGNTFKRRHEGDYHCSDDEIRQMFADSNLHVQSSDARILKGYTIEDIDLQTLKLYRRNYNARHEGHPWTGLSDMDFLSKIEAFRKDRASGEKGFTVAGMLMFGKTSSITDQECLPWFFPDYREHFSAERWSDRLYPDGTWQANLYQFFTNVFIKMSRLLPKPFVLADDGKTRLEYTSAHIALREALVNACVHASYTQIGGITIDCYLDKILICNQGSMLVSVEEFYEGNHSICRNPILQKMFVFLGLGEKAGSGADIILKGWSENNWERPVITQHNDPQYVELMLQMPSISPTGTKQGLSREQVEKQSGLSWSIIEQLLKAVQEPISSSELRQLMRFSNATKFKHRYLNPLLTMQLVTMTQPDSPKSPTQKYVLTTLGKTLLH
ncbi:MAG: putative DNA binding domain-containing protein [Bacteroidales bacterium]|nr:putative DNA binding domain-containing protein [Bacteroidales bacterium]